VFATEKVVEQMKCLVKLRGAPESITTDDGSEFAGQAMDAWEHQVGVSSTSSGQAALCRTATSKASTAGCGTNV